MPTFALKLIAHSTCHGVDPCTPPCLSAQVPTTVFAPMEYACAGETEEDAIAARGDGGVDVYHIVHQPLEMAAVHRSDPQGVEDQVCVYAVCVLCACLSLSVWVWLGVSACACVCARACGCCSCC